MEKGMSRYTRDQIADKFCVLCHRSGLPERVYIFAPPRCHCPPHNKLDSMDLQTLSQLFATTYNADPNIRKAAEIGRAHV